MRRAERAGGQVVGRQFAAGIETEPADPQHRGAERGVGQVVRPHVFMAEAEALADQQCADQRRDTGADMHDGAAGEIERTAHQRRDARDGHIRQPSTAPHQVTKREINERAPQAQKQHHRAELHAFGERTADQARRNDEEHALEEHVRESRNMRRRGAECRLNRRGGALRPAAGDVLHEQKVAVADVGLKPG